MKNVRFELEDKRYIQLENNLEKKDSGEISNIKEFKNIEKSKLKKINEDKTKKEIKIEYNGSEKVIDLTKERKIFYNETLGYTCIEILKDEDNIEYDNLLKIERNIPIVKPD